MINSVPPADAKGQWVLEEKTIEEQRHKGSEGREKNRQEHIGELKTILGQKAAPQP